MKSSSACAFCLLALTGGVHAAVINFDTEADFTNNFRTGGIAFTYGTGVMQHGGNNTTATAIYDLNGSTAGTTTFNVPVGSSLTVTCDVQFSGSNATTSSSFGVIFAGGGIANLALLNSLTGNDTIRIFSGSDLAGGAGSNAGLPSDTTTDVVTAGSFYTLTSKYTVLTSNTYSISMSIGAKTVSYTFTGTPSTAVEVGFRAFNPPDSGYVVSVDNVDISVIPEPSTALIASVGGLSAMLRRRRK